MYLLINSKLILNVFSLRFSWSRFWRSYGSFCTFLCQFLDDLSFRKIITRSSNNLQIGSSNNLLSCRLKPMLSEGRTQESFLIKTFLPWNLYAGLYARFFRWNIIINLFCWKRFLFTSGYTMGFFLPVSYHSSGNISEFLLCCRLPVH